MGEYVSKEEYEVTQRNLAALMEQVEKLKRMLPYRWISRKEAGLMINRDPQTVSDIAKRGELTYRKEGRKIEFDIRSVIEYQEKYKIEAQGS